MDLRRGNRAVRDETRRADLCRDSGLRLDLRCLSPSSLDESGLEPSRAMDIAIRDAGLTPDDIDYINLHGTSTELNDRIETRAIKLCFGKRASSIPMSATKSMVGHPQGASGASGISAILFAMEQSMIPATLNLEDPDPECDLDYVPLVPRRARYGMHWRTASDSDPRTRC